MLGVIPLKGYENSSSFNANNVDTSFAFVACTDDGTSRNMPEDYMRCYLLTFSIHPTHRAQVVITTNNQRMYYRSTNAGTAGYSAWKLISAN